MFVWVPVRVAFDNIAPVRMVFDKSVCIVEFSNVASVRFASVKITLFDMEERVNNARVRFAPEKLISPVKSDDFKLAYVRFAFVKFAELK